MEKPIPPKTSRACDWCYGSPCRCAPSWGLPIALGAAALAFGLLVAFAPADAARPVTCGKTTIGQPFEIGIARIKDGDTFEGTCADRHGRVEVFRLSGLDTPEKGNAAKCIEERVENARATAYAMDLASRAGMRGKAIMEPRPDKYGRELVSVTFRLEGKTVSWRDAMIEMGFAMPYSGGTKPDWCAILAPLPRPTIQDSQL